MEKLKHENCVKLNQVYEDKNYIYLVMDFLEEGSVSKVSNY